MKKSILNIGKALTRAEQKKVFGGNLISEGSTTTCFCENGPKIIGGDCSFCKGVCSIRGGYKDLCIEWGEPT